jgi:sugar phosphate isomerase/epimerase
MKALKAIAVLLVLCMTLPSCTQPAEKKVERNVGLQMYSLRDDIGRNGENIAEVIKEVGKMGYKYIETASYFNGMIYGMTPEAFKALLAENGLFALSCHVGRRLPDNVSQANWDEIWAWWDQCIAAHKAVGMKYIITPSMPIPETLEDLKVYCDYYNQIGEKCLAAGMKFGFHNHAIEFEKTYPGGTVMFDFMVQNTDPDKVFYQLDVYWAVIGQRAPVELFKRYPGRFDVLHIKDLKELGESGMVGFDAIFKHIATAGTEYLIVEIERYDLPRYESVQACLDYLNNACFIPCDLFRVE